MQNFYQTLGVPSDADQNRIKAAYRALAMSCHPDRNTSDRAAASRFKIITEAYEALRDPQSRAAYDFGLIHAQSAQRARVRRLRSAAGGGFILAMAVALLGGRLWFTQAAPPTPPDTSTASVTEPKPAVEDETPPAAATSIAAAPAPIPVPDIDDVLRWNLAAVPIPPADSELAELAALAPAAADLDAALRQNLAAVPAPPPVNALAELTARAPAAPVVDLEASLREAASQVPQPPGALQDLLPRPAPAPKPVIVQYRPAAGPSDLAALLEPAPRPEPLTAAALAWAALQDSRDVTALGAFAANFGHAEEARLARARIALLTPPPELPAQTAEPPAAAADAVATFRPGNWTVLRSSRFQFVLKYPANIFVTTTKSGATERRLASRDGLAELVIYAARTPPGLNLQAIRQSVVDERYSTATFDYSPVGKAWFVLSGLNGQDAFYERVTVSCDERQMHGWRLTYPVAQRKLYERVVEDIHRTYRHGSSACVEHKRNQQAAEARDSGPTGITTAQQLGR